LVEVTGVPTGLPYITDIRLYQLHLYFLPEGCYSIKTYMAGLNHFICGWLKHFTEGKCKRRGYYDWSPYFQSAIHEYRVCLNGTAIMQKKV
jgi:hypothetical protein